MVAQNLIANETSFAALVMAATQMADPNTYKLLVETWPEIWSEYVQRTHTPVGYLEGELEAMQADSKGEA